MVIPSRVQKARVHANSIHPRRGVTALLKEKLAIAGEDRFGLEISQQDHRTIQVSPSGLNGKTSRQKSIARKASFPISMVTAGALSPLLHIAM